MLSLRLRGRAVAAVAVGFPVVVSVLHCPLAAGGQIPEKPLAYEALRKAIKRYFMLAPGAYSSRIADALHGRVRAAGHRIRRMPLELSDAELATAAMACRAMAYQVEGVRET